MAHDSESICLCKHCLNPQPIPSFRKWSLKRLRAEAKRLGMPKYNEQSKQKLVDNLIDAYQP
jgi:hypothetical protein